MGLHHMSHIHVVDYTLWYNIWCHTHIIYIYIIYIYVCIHRHMISVSLIGGFKFFGFQPYCGIDKQRTI